VTKVATPTVRTDRHGVSVQKLLFVQDVEKLLVMECCNRGIVGGGLMMPLMLGTENMVDYHVEVRSAYHTVKRIGKV
jgi:hypothetical protein